MSASHHNNMKMAGFYLLEVLLAILLSMLALSLVLNIFLAVERSYQMQYSLWRLEHHAKKAITVLAAEIQQAGHIGCAHLTQDFPLYAPNSYRITPTNKLTAQAAGELLVRYVKFPSSLLVTGMQDAYTLHVSGEDKFNTNAVLMISDCQQAEIFQVKNSRLMQGSQYLITSQALHKKFLQQAELGPIVVHRFYVDKTKHKNSDGSWQYALFLDDELKQTKTEWVTGIRAMRIFFTVKRAGRIVTLAATENNAREQVLGVAIDLDLIEPPLKKTWHSYVSLQET